MLHLLTTFEQCTWGTLTVAKHLCREEKLLGFTIQGSFASVYAVELSDWELNLVPAALFLRLSSTNLMRINKMNKVLLSLCLQRLLQICWIFYFKHILCSTERAALTPVHVW